MSVSEVVKSTLKVRKEAETKYRHAYLSKLYILKGIQYKWKQNIL